MSTKTKDLETDQAGPGPVGAADSTAGAAREVDPAAEVTAPAEGSAAEGELEIEMPSGPSAEERIAELEAKQKETHDRLLRALADNENFKRRVKKDVEDARLDAGGKVLKEMLPVVDNLERALSHAEKQGASDEHGVVAGVKLVLRQFVQAFERCGVTPIDAKGKPFDPNLHEAVSQVETADHPAGTVLEVLQTGYKIGDRLLRPTLTVVTKAPPASAEPAPADDASGASES